MSSFNTIAENPNSTVVAEYVPDKKDATHYQSENELELELIRLLRNNGYEYLTIKSDGDLIQNLRAQLSKLNDMVFSEAEWQQMLTHYLANKNEGIEEKTTKVQEDHIFNLKRDDGSTKNVRIIGIGSGEQLANDGGLYLAEVEAIAIQCHHAAIILLAERLVNCG